MVSISQIHSLKKGREIMQKITLFPVMPYAKKREAAYTASSPSSPVLILITLSIGWMNIFPSPMFPV